MAIVVLVVSAESVAHVKIHLKHSNLLVTKKKEKLSGLHGKSLFIGHLLFLEPTTSLELELQSNKVGCSYTFNLGSIQPTTYTMRCILHFIDMS